MRPHRSILAVDDDALFLNILRDLLTAGGFGFEGLTDSAKAVPKALSFAPSLIIADRTMPVLSGGELLRSLASFPATASIPVVLITIQGSEREIIRGVLAGAVDVIHKPFRPEHVERLHVLLDERDEEVPRLPVDAFELPARNLVNIFKREQRDGNLFLNPGTPFEGVALFRRGEFVRAEFGPARNTEALREMLQTEDGVWHFEENASTRRTDPVMRAASSDAVPVGMPQFQPRVLVVDDDPELRHLFKHQLTRAGYEVVLAEDGVAGAEAARRTPFDLIIADLNMPRLDGWGMLKLVQADLRCREVPVVFLSAHDDYRETLRAARVGAHDYLAKTGKAEDVVARTATLIAPRRAAWAAFAAGRPHSVSTHQFGAQWTLRALGRVKATGTLSLQDDWCRYTVWIRDGAVVDARAKWPRRESTGLPAVAALLVAKTAEGAFRPEPVGPETRIALPLEALIDKTIQLVHQLEARLTSTRLGASSAFVVDEVLFELYQQIGPVRGVEVARAICDQRVQVADLAQHLGMRTDEVLEILKELLRRGVLSFREAA